LKADFECWDILARGRLHPRFDNDCLRHEKGADFLHRSWKRAALQDRFPV